MKCFDLTEWNTLGADLANESEEKYRDVCERLRIIIDAQRTINAHVGPVQRAFGPVTRSTEVN